VQHWDGKQVNVDDITPTISGYFPQAKLLTATDNHVPDILEALGAKRFPVAYLPRLIPELPEDWFTLKRYPPGPQQTATDPVVELIASVWNQLDDDDQDTFATAAQEEPIVPVGTPSDDGQVTRVRAVDTELYTPRQDDALDADIPGVRFVTESVYRPRDRLGNQALPPAIQHRQSVIKQVWRPDRFQFDELVRTTLRPRLNGEGDTEDEKQTVDLRLLALLRNLGAETVDPDDPLPLRDRYDAQPLYLLCELPVPTQDHGWVPAHRVYFGDEWLTDETPQGVEQLFSKAEIDAPILIPPRELEEGLETTELSIDDGIDSKAWFSFLRWIGITPHLRLRSFFDPNEQRRFSDTIAQGGVKRPPQGSSVLGDLDQKTWKQYQNHLEAALDEMSAGRQKYDSIYRVNSFEY
jgi:hypothetical protein